MMSSIMNTVIIGIQSLSQLSLNTPLPWKSLCIFKAHKSLFAALEGWSHTRQVDARTKVVGLQVSGAQEQRVYTSRKVDLYAIPFHLSDFCIL